MSCGVPLRSAVAATSSFPVGNLTPARSRWRDDEFGLPDPSRIGRLVAERRARHVRTAASGGRFRSSRGGAGPKLGRRLEDSEEPLGALGQLRLQHLRLPEERGEPLVACRLGVEGVAVAAVGAAQGMVEDAYEVIVLVPGARGLLAVVHALHSSRSLPRL